MGEFIEPETKVRVKIVGSMHYNPTSIQLAKNTIEKLGMVDELGSVIIESCDIRWEDSQTMDPVTKRVLRSEMGAASEKAFSFNRPVVLGDQRINVTISNLRSAFKETVIDLSLPPKGWQRFARNISARLLLKELLQERNEVLAESILNQCRIYETKKDDEKKSIFPINIPFFSSPQGMISPNYNEGVFYATSKSTKPQDTQDSMTEKTVVAVLGMAHCNGVMKLLAEGKVK